MSGRRLAAVAVAVILAGGLTSAGLALAAVTGTRPQRADGPARQAGFLTAADARLLNSAEQILIRTCMAQHGFRYWPVPLPSDPQFPYLNNSVAWARRHGFGREPTGLQQAVSAGNRYLSQLPAARRQAYGVALNGVGPGGPGVTAALPQGGGLVGQNTGSCRTRAQTQLYRDFRVWFQAKVVTDNLPAIWQSQVLGHPGYRHAVRRWAACVRAAGYRYSSPLSAAFEPTAESRPRPPEIRLAVTDARCVRGAGLDSVGRRLSAHYARPLQARYGAEISAGRRLSLAALPRARAIVGLAH